MNKKGFFSVFVENDIISSKRFLNTNLKKGKDHVYRTTIMSKLNGWHHPKEDCSPKTSSSLSIVRLSKSFINWKRKNLREKQSGGKSGWMSCECLCEKLSFSQSMWKSFHLFSFKLFFVFSIRFYCKLFFLSHLIRFKI